MKNPLNDLTTNIIEFHEHILSWEHDVIKRTGLSSTQTHIIEYLGGYGDENKSDPPKMNTIANKMGITTGSLTVAIDILEKKGYVERKAKPDDRRAYRITLTENGNQLYREHRRFHLELTENGTADFSEEEKKAFADYLQRFTENI